MAIPHGYLHHENLPWWSHLSPSPKIPTLPSRKVDPQYPEHLLPYVNRDRTQGALSAAPFPSFSDFLNEDGSLKPYDLDTPPAGGLLGIIEQYLRNNGQRGY